MTWDSFPTNDGTSIPGIAFGTWTLGGGTQGTAYIGQAICVGFSHIDTAQMYGNETEAGRAIRESGLAREEVYITTKYSGTNGLDIETSIRDSLRYLGVDYVDLYLIHFPHLATPDIPTAWAKMEKIKQEGLAKWSIGVSNFGVPELQILLDSAKIKPAANQIELHPYSFAQQLPTIELAKEHGIVIEAFSILFPLTRQPGGPVDKPVNTIAERLKVHPEQVLLAWAKSKGVVVVTSSRKRERLKGYISAGDIDLTVEDIASIDGAGT
ncbi:Aldo/keto reductase [Trametes cingulata]|nr:Aldo/keto reductase [Trametes cingulata]